MFFNTKNSIIKTIISDIKEGIETSYSIEDETATFTFLEEIKVSQD